jgi:hypothetical protein
MEDIVCSCPYYCDDCDKWHITHYWAYDDGTYSECDSDGNHDGCDEEDVPTFEECDDAWCDYSKHVLETGEDELSAFTIYREKEVTFVAVLADEADGIIVKEIRSKRHRYKPGRAPKAAQEYLQMQFVNDYWRMADLGCGNCHKTKEEHANGKCLFASSHYEPQCIATLHKRIDRVEVKNGKAYHTFKALVTGPLSEYERKLKSRARRHIKEHEKRKQDERSKNAEKDGLPEAAVVQA